MTNQHRDRASHPATSKQEDLCAVKPAPCLHFISNRTLPAKYYFQPLASSLGASFRRILPDSAEQEFLSNAPMQHDIVIVDIASADDLRFVLRLQAQEWDCVSCVICHAGLEIDVGRLLSMGFSGIFCESISKEGMIAAVELMRAGERFVSPVFSIDHRSGVSTSPISRRIDSRDRREEIRVSAAEQRVLGCLCLGMSTRDIAAHLERSEATIKATTNALLKKFSVSNRVQLVLVTLGKPYFSDGRVQTLE